MARNARLDQLYRSNDLLTPVIVIDNSLIEPFKNSFKIGFKLSNFNVSEIGQNFSSRALNSILRPAIKSSRRDESNKMIIKQ